jgi:uncharacterized protein (TIGR00266 family)
MTRSDYEYAISAKPDFSFLSVRLKPEQTLKVEASAMAIMDTNLRMKTKMRGGFARFLTGESVFLNEFTADKGPGEIGIAPGSPGDMEHLYLENTTVYLQNSAFLASSPGIKIESKWQGFVKGFFSGQKLFLIRCSGQGDLWFNTYGALIPVDVSGEYIVDTGHVVGFTDGLQYQVSKVGGYKSLFFSGEGLVCKFTGQGRVWIQTRKIGAFGSWVRPFRPKKKRLPDIG